MIWQPAGITIAAEHGPRAVPGYVNAGLGLFAQDWEPGTWSLTHLNTGHKVATLYGDRIDQVLPIASQIAACGDWVALSADAWAADPGGLVALRAAVLAVADKHVGRCDLAASGRRHTGQARSIENGLKTWGGSPRGTA